MSTSSRFALVAALFLAALCLPSLVDAQTTPPDVIRLRDGTFLRGTLVERSSTQVVVMLQTGETRTYAADLVEFAGPDAQPVAPTPPPAPPPNVYVQAAAAPRERVARLRVRTTQSALSLQQLQGSATVPVWTGRVMTTAQVDQFGILCNAPCDIELREGTYQLGVAQGTGAATRAGAPMDLRGDMTLNVGYADRSGTRLGGWLLFGIGGAVGTALMMGAIFAGPAEYSPYGGSSHNTLSMPMLIGGGIVFTASMIIGMILAMTRDSASIDVEGGAVRF